MRYQRLESSSNMHVWQRIRIASTSTRRPPSPLESIESLESEASLVPANPRYERPLVRRIRENSQRNVVNKHSGHVQFLRRVRCLENVYVLGKVFASVMFTTRPFDDLTDIAIHSTCHWRVQKKGCADEQGRRAEPKIVVHPRGRPS